jgi:acyl-CoA synthetase (AMP-forming)/AMP-acid ligase II
MLHARVQVVNEKDEICPTAEVGEVRVSGGFLMNGYYQADEITKKTLKDGWLYTGDMGRLDDEGYLYLVDRKQFMIITGGYNVYPIEVENVIADHPAVQEVCVFGVPHEKWGEAIHAAIVSRRGATTSADEIMNWCRERLSSFKVPKSLEFRDGLIRGATGKILKRAERDRYLETL